MYRLQICKLKKVGCRLNRLLILVPLAFYQACSGVTSGSGLSQQDCASFEALLLDTEFQTVGDPERLWRYRQHAGQLSFSAISDGGELTFSRIGSEPWAVLSQRISSPLLSGREVVYSADLKGDISGEVTHAFGAKSGLYLQPGPRRGANMADHEPNLGQWDWQRVTISASVPQSIDYVEVGFIYQGGAGLLFAKNPSLKLAECGDDS